MTRPRSLVAIVLGLIACCLTSGAATAASFRIGPGGAIRLTSLGKLTFEAGTNVACNVTLGGTLYTSLYAKSPITPFGELTDVRWRECTGGEIERVQNLPWYTHYEGILGILPEQVTGFEYYVEAFDIKFNTFGGFIRCRYSGSVRFLTRVSGSNPYTLGLATAAPTFLLLVEGGGCPASGVPRVTLALEPTQRITRL